MSPHSVRSVLPVQEVGDLEICLQQVEPRSRILRGEHTRELDSRIEANFGTRGLECK